MCPHPQHPPVLHVLAPGARGTSQSASLNFWYSIQAIVAHNKHNVFPVPVGDSSIAFLP